MTIYALNNNLFEIVNPRNKITKATKWTLHFNQSIESNPNNRCALFYGSLVASLEMANVITIDPITYLCIHFPLIHTLCAILEFSTLRSTRIAAKRGLFTAVLPGEHTVIIRLVFSNSMQGWGYYMRISCIRASA